MATATLQQHRFPQREYNEAQRGTLPTFAICFPERGDQKRGTTAQPKLDTMTGHERCQLLCPGLTKYVTGSLLFRTWESETSKGIAVNSARPGITANQFCFETGSILFTI